MNEDAKPSEHACDDELSFIAYLAGELSPEQDESIDRHVLGCDRCWRDVQLVRAGQAATQAAAGPVPEHVRARFAAVFAKPADAPATITLPSVNPSVSFVLRRRVLTAIAAFTLAAVAFLGGIGVANTAARPSSASAIASQPGATVAPSTTPTTSRTQHQSPASPDTPPVLDAAIARYNRGQLPGTGIPTQPAPELLDLGLHLMAAGTGSLINWQVTVYAYANPSTGEQIFVYLSSEPFNAVDLPAGHTTGTRTVDKLTVFSATVHPMLVLGANPALVAAVGTRLT